MNSRRYSLFASRRGTGVWLRLSPIARPQPQAAQVFQDSLLSGFLTYPEWEFRLRPVKDGPEDALDVLKIMQNREQVYGAGS
jgi:hypothetical protein